MIFKHNKYIFRFSLSIFAIALGFGSYCEASSNSERRAARDLQKLDQHRSLINEARQAWTVSQKIKGSGGYDTNINTSPGVGTSSEIARAGIYHLLYDALAFRVIDDTSINFNFSGFYDGYTKHTKLNYGSLVASTRLAHHLNKRCVIGSLLSGLRHWQPRMYDINLQSQSTSFTHWGFSAHPFVSFSPVDTIILHVNYLFNLEDYAKATTPGTYPFSSTEHKISGYLEKESNGWKVRLSGDWDKKDFSKFLAFAVDANGLGSSNTEGIKMKLRNTQGKLLVGYNFSDLFDPTVSYTLGKNKDLYEGFESYDFYTPEASINSEFTLANHLHNASLTGSLEKRKYKKQGSESELASTGKMTLLKYKTWHASAEDQWQWKDGWSIFEKVAYERQSTNETESEANRSFTRWIVQLGVVRSF